MRPAAPLRQDEGWTDFKNDEPVSQKSIPEPKVHEYKEPEKIIDEVMSQEPSIIDSAAELKTPVEEKFHAEPSAPEKVEKAEDHSERSPVHF